MLRCDVITLFPEMLMPILDSSILKRAREKDQGWKGKGVVENG